MEPQSLKIVLASTADVAAFGLFGQAGPAIQVVNALLLGSLIWILITAAGKYLELMRARQEADAFERLFWSGLSLDELYARTNGQPKGPLSAVFLAAMYEWRRTMETSPRALAGVQGRMERLMSVAAARETDRLGRGLVTLEIMAIVTPLLGLAGALWGAMAGLAGAQGFEVFAADATPGLFAGALGLLVAAVATGLHRGLRRGVQGMERRIRDFAQEFIVIASRQIDASL